MATVLGRSGAILFAPRVFFTQLHAGLFPSPSTLFFRGTMSIQREATKQIAHLHIFWLIYVAVHLGVTILYVFTICFPCSAAVSPSLFLLPSFVLFWAWFSFPLPSLPISRVQTCSSFLCHHLALNSRDPWGNPFLPKLCQTITQILLQQRRTAKAEVNSFSPHQCIHTGKQNTSWSEFVPLWSHQTWKSPFSITWKEQVFLHYLSRQMVLQVLHHLRWP